LADHKPTAHNPCRGYPLGAFIDAGANNGIVTHGVNLLLSYIVAQMRGSVQFPNLFLPLPRSRFSRILEGMEVHFTAETEKKLKDLAAQSGRENAAELVQDVVEGYFDDLVQTRDMLNRRYDDLKSGTVKPIDGEEFFENLRRREDELLKKHSPQ
jgi:hypothetical protein